MASFFTKTYCAISFKICTCFIRCTTILLLTHTIGEVHCQWFMCLLYAVTYFPIPFSKKSVRMCRTVKENLDH